MYYSKYSITNPLVKWAIGLIIDDTTDDRNQYGFYVKAIFNLLYSFSNASLNKYSYLLDFISNFRLIPSRRQNSDEKNLPNLDTDYHLEDQAVRISPRMIPCQ